MREIHYKKSSLFSQAIGCSFLAAGSAWATLNIDHVQIKLFCGFLALTLPFLCLALFRRAMGPGVAFAYDSSNLIVTSLFGEAVIPWGQVQSINRETLQQSSLFGLIKKDVAKEIAILFHENGGNRKLKVNISLIDVAEDAIPAMIADMARYGRMAGQSPDVVTNNPFSGLHIPSPFGSSKSSTFGRR